MKGFCIAVGVLLIVAASVSPAAAQDSDKYKQAQHLMDSTRLVYGNIFAPKTYEKAQEKFEYAESAISHGKKDRTIDKYLDECAEYAENTLKATEVAKLTLQEYLDPRERAIAAKAPDLVPELYQKAEDQFLKATTKVESGDVKNGLKEADKAMPLFNEAELQAIKADIMGTADKLIEKAIQGEAEKYALSTLDKAKTARAKCDAILSNDRYERTESIAEINRAEYEARHADNIAQSVRSLERNDQAWEKLMLVYEIQMNRIASAVGASQVPFDNGPIAAADTLITYIQDLQKERDASEELNQDLAMRLKSSLERFDTDVVGNDPVELAKALDTRLQGMLEEKDRLAGVVTEERYKLSQLQEQHQEVSAELQERTAREAKFKQAKSTLNPSEGEVLFNSSNDIVLRLSGLSFDVNKSEIKDEHIPLLEKVKTIIQLFPDSKLLVEGHTDDQGVPSANTLLSEKRAMAVMQYLRQSLLISADRISSIGYGSEKPVASNKTADGRAKNRRIDIIIMQ